MQRDIHGALVGCEAALICRAFYVDGRRPWRLAADDSTEGVEATDRDMEVVSVAIDYTSAPLAVSAPSGSGSAPHRART